MASVLTTTTINALISSYETTQRNILVQPLTVRQSKYEKLNTAYSDITTKLNTLKSSLTALKQTSNDSAFAVKTSSTSISSVVTASAGNSAGVGSYSFHVNQLAKSDVAVSQSLDSATANAVAGTHTFQITTGDGEGGQFISNIEVEFSGSETNQTMMEAIRDAINSDTAVVTSDAKTAADTYSGGAGEFTIDLNGTLKTVSYSGGGTYEDLIDELTSYINTNIDGVTAEKISDSPNPGDVRLQLSVDNSSNYISITHSSGFDVVIDLNISATKEKAASSVITASVFSPSSGKSQFSLTAKNTGLDYRITSLDDTGSSSALTELGLNLGSARTTFDQGANTSGFVYSDITDANNLLNAKYTFNGLSLQNSLNQVSGLVNDTTFNLKAVQSGTDPDAVVKISTDTSAIKTTIQDFIKAFNDLYTYIKDQSTSSSEARGVLSGQANAGSLLEMLRNIAYNPVSGLGEGKIKYLTQIGITFDYNTGLSISNASLLEKKLSENTADVENMFNNSSSGIAVTLYNKIDPYLGAGGYIAKTKSSFDTNISYIKNRITSVEDRISKSSENLRSQYEKLQSQLEMLSNLSVQYFGS